MNGLTVNSDANDLVGAANKAWVPAIHHNDNEPGSVYSVDAYTVAYRGTTGYYNIFKLPLPTNLGGKKLYITGMRVYIKVADAANYVDRQILVGSPASNAAGTTLHDDVANYPTGLPGTTDGSTEHTFAAVDCSSYRGILYLVRMVKGTDGVCRLHGAELQCYYDT